jgi:SAM-dependent methyltransferase
LTIDLARRVDPGPVVGIDLSSQVISEASATARTAGAPNVTFLTGDFRSTTLAPASFDVVHAHQVLQHLRDPVDALVAMRGLARPGGIVAARDSDYSAMTWSPASRSLERWLEIYLAVTARNGADANAGRWLARWAQQAGFDEVAYTASRWTFATPSDVSWWAELWAERTVGSSFARQAVDYGIATTDELATVATGWRTWAAEAGGAFVVPHGEVIAQA